MAERLGPRTASAVCVVTLAAYTEPQTVGIYAWAVLALTGFRAITEQAVRQLMLRAVRTRIGRNWLKRYSVTVGSVGPIVVSGLLAIVCVSVEVQDRYTLFTTLVPLAAVPSVAAFSLRALSMLHWQERWRDLASAQVVSSMLSLAVSIPMIIGGHALLGAVLQIVVTEVLNAAWMCMRTRRLAIPFEIHSAPKGRVDIAAYASMAGYSLIGWSQAQADRLLLGAVAGTSVLGTYSMAVALGRSAGDSLAAGTANALRSRLAGADEVPHASSELRDRAENVLHRATAMASFSAILVSVGCVAVVGPILGPVWNDAIEVVPIVALAALPATLAWSTAVLHVASGSTRVAVLAPASGLVMVPFIAVAASHNLTLAAWLLVVREALVCTVGFALKARAAPWRSYRLCGVYLGALSLVVVATMQTNVSAFGS